MRSDKPSPSLVPQIPGFDVAVYLVLDDFGSPVGRAYREVDENETDKETLIRNLLAGAYERPVRVVAFNTAEGWSRDVSEDIAREVWQRAIAERQELPFGAKAFAEYHLGEDCLV
jgi:hypothetical protein